MRAEAAVLSRAWPVLDPEIDPDDPRDLVIVRTGRARRRSSIFFLGLSGGGARWVFKQPNDWSQQVDLQSPLPAARQFEALQRLHRHLQCSDGSVGTPRPVAYVPELDAYIMEFVPGRTLAELLTPRAVLRPDSLLDAVSSAAAVLKAVHSVEPGTADAVDVEAWGRLAVKQARQVLRAADLPTAERWFVPTRSTRREIAVKVLLHGDFCPENVLLSPSGPVCLEPDLCVRDWAEHDVVRFLVMLFDAPLFVTGVHVPAVQDLRRRAAATFLNAFYGDNPWPRLLQPLMVTSLAARWSTRHTDVAKRAPRLQRSREVLLRWYFEALLDEVSSPAWPGLPR